MAYRTALQDWRAWMEEGILDMNVPMVFCAQTNPIYAQVFSDWAGFAMDHKYNRQVVIGQGSWINPIAGTLAQIQVARQPTAAGNRADGIALYNYALPAGDVTNRPAFVAALASSANPSAAFATAVPVPEMPWKTQPTKGHLVGYVRGNAGARTLDGAAITLTGPVQRRLTSDATGFYGAVDLPPGTSHAYRLFPRLRTRHRHLHHFGRSSDHAVHPAQAGGLSSEAARAETSCSPGLVRRRPGTTKAQSVGQRMQAAPKKNLCRGQWGAIG